MGRLTDTHCPACGSARRRLVSEYAFGVWGCRNCGERWWRRIDSAEGST